jgi:hypothetical protein
MIEFLMITPYLAIAASLTLAGTVAAICYTQPAPRRSGFTA